MWSFGSLLRNPKVLRGKHKLTRIFRTLSEKAIRHRINWYAKVSAERTLKERLRISIDAGARTTGSEACVYCKLLLECWFGRKRKHPRKFAPRSSSCR